MVAGTNYRVLAQLNSQQQAAITAFQPLPSTGQPLQITSLVLL